MRIFIATFAAILVAGGSGFYLLNGLQPPQQAVAAVPAEAPQQVRVLVPSASLAAGSLLAPQNLAEMPLGLDSVTEEMIVADEAGRTLLLGSVARQALPKGVPIARSAVVQPGERGFLAAVLPQGKRAISIPISETAGLSGLVMPGDRVDIILTYSISGDVIDAEREIRASETVLIDLRVLALDQRMSQGEASMANQVDFNKSFPIARAATLEVTPQQAEMLTLSTQLGELSLVLNSVQDGGVENADEAPTVDVAAIAAAVTGDLAEAATTRRALTLDSQVTSLLRRAPAAQPSMATIAAEPTLAERTARVQVVRGIDSRALEIEPEVASAGQATFAQTAAAGMAAAPPPSQ